MVIKNETEKNPYMYSLNRLFICALDHILGHLKIHKNIVKTKVKTYVYSQALFTR